MSAATDPSESLDHPGHPDARRLDRAVTVLSLLGEPTRLEMLWLLTERPRTVSDLVERTGTSRTSVSQHLAKLRMAGLVEAVRDGRSSIYSVRGGHVARLVREALNEADHQVSGEPPHS